MCCTWFGIAGGINSRKNHIHDADYSKWLGPEWKSDLKEFRDSKKAGTYVSNHVGVVDIMMMHRVFYGGLGFVAADFLSKVALLSKCISVSEGLFISREGSREERLSGVTNIVARQRELEDKNCPRNPLLIFPEGFTSNNTTINKFRRGGFESLCAVMPLVIKYHTPTVFPGNQTMLDHIPLVLHMCTLDIDRCEIICLPPFVPNEYLFSHPDYKHLPKWEAYAEAVRDVMCHYSGLGKSDVSLQTFKNYNQEMVGKKGQLSWNNKFKSD